MKNGISYLNRKIREQISEYARDGKTFFNDTSGYSYFSQLFMRAFMAKAYQKHFK